MASIRLLGVIAVVVEVVEKVTSVAAVGAEADIEVTVTSGVVVVVDLGVIEAMESSVVVAGAGVVQGLLGQDRLMTSRRRRGLSPLKVRLRKTMPDRDKNMYLSAPARRRGRAGDDSVAFLLACVLACIASFQGA